MIYTPRCFAADLLQYLESDFDMKRFCQWALDLYFKHCTMMELELEKIFFRIAIMKEDASFEMTEQQLKDLAKQLKRQSI